MEVRRRKAAADPSALNYQPERGIARDRGAEMGKCFPVCSLCSVRKDHKMQRHKCTFRSIMVFLIDSYK